MGTKPSWEDDNADDKENIHDIAHLAGMPCQAVSRQRAEHDQKAPGEPAVISRLLTVAPIKLALIPAPWSTSVKDCQ